MVKIHETVDTLTLQFLANVGNVGPVTLKKRPIVIRAPTMPAMKSHVAHWFVSFISSLPVMALKNKCPYLTHITMITL